MGRGRLPSDVTSELMDVLADEPHVVLCDLTGMAAAGPAIADMFGPVVTYLADWPGTVVVVTVPDAAVRSRLEVAARGAERLCVQAGTDVGPVEAQAMLPPLRGASLQLSPEATAPRHARDFVVRTLHAWEMGRVSSAACLVVSELVTNSILHAVTVMDLRLSLVEGRVRIAVRDRGGGRPSAQPSARPGDQIEQTLDGRGLQLVQAFSSSWGVIPAQARGKTVWAVLDDADALATSG